MTTIFRICLVVTLCLISLSGASGQQIESASSFLYGNETVILFPESLLQSCDDSTVEIYADGVLVDEVSSTDIQSMGGLGFISSTFGSDVELVLGIVVSNTSGEASAIILIDPPTDITVSQLPLDVRNRLFNLCSDQIEVYGPNDFTHYDNNTDPRLPEGGDY